MFGRLIVANYKNHIDRKRESEKRAKENEADFWNRHRKENADKEAIARIRLENETDPIKRKKMECRLSQGITDFSDL